MTVLTIFRSSLVFALLLNSFYASTQFLTQISTSWDDKLDEWIIYTDDEDLEGSIVRKWVLGNDYSWWKFELDDLSGDIKQKWDNNPNLWELRASDGSVINIRTAWTGDFTEWIFSIENKSYRLKSKYRNVLSEWIIDQSKEEQFYVFMANEGDPRDWIIEDYIEEGNLSLSIGISFIAILHTIRR